MHFVKAKGILSAKNGMNLYHGCSHGCIYCDYRSKCYYMEYAFEDIEVKENAIDLLEYTLIHKRKKRMIGTVSDSELRETQAANYFSDIYPIDSAVLSANAQFICR